MNASRIKWLVVVSLAVIGSTCATVWGQAASARMQLPASEPLQSRPGSFASATDNQIQTLQTQVKRAPDDYAQFSELGAAYLQKARETGDIAFYDLAEKALKKSLALAPRDFRSAKPLVRLGLVCMGEHRFTDALTYAQEALSLGSGDLAPFALEGDAYIDVGDYEEARSAYEALRRLGQSISSPLSLAYMLDSRLAYLSFLHGDSAETVRLMNSAITAALQTREPRENLAWLYFELGERYFQSGDLANAERSYSAGIAADPNHYRSLAGLAKVRSAQGRYDESIQLYQRSIGIIPFPVYLAELGDVYEKLGRSKEAQEQYDLVMYIGRLGKLNQVLANRELALFYADRGIKLPEALELAQKELEVRHDIYTWDALAWVLYNMGGMPYAATNIKNALHKNTNDSLLLFHAGMIYRSVGDNSSAEQYLKRALEINPHFSLFFPDVANQTLADVAHSRKPELRSSNARQ
jgi:tetratricopeptide (TPR) repeat protein